MNKTQQYYQDNKEKQKIYSYNYYHNLTASDPDYKRHKQEKTIIYQEKYQKKHGHKYRERKKYKGISMTLKKNHGNYVISFD